MQKNSAIPNAYDLLHEHPVHQSITTHLDQLLKDAENTPGEVADAVQCFAAAREFRALLDLELRTMERHFAQEAWRAGATWAELAEAAGITRQTAQQTYRDTRLTFRRRAGRREDESWPEALDGTAE